MKLMNCSFELENFDRDVMPPFCDFSLSGDMNNKISLTQLKMD